MVDDKRLYSILRHIEHVRESCLLLGEKLIERGEDDCGLRLIANGQIHDASKLSGSEWLYLNDETKAESPSLFSSALNQHRCTNPHHPEYWSGGVKDMPRVYLAEMVCDVKSRSSEFGTDIREWVKDEFTKKYKLSCNCTQYREMKDFLDLLLEQGFKK